MYGEKITSLIYHDQFKNPQEATVWLYWVVEILEHQARGEGDKWYYDIIGDNWNVTRVFQPVIVNIRNS